MPSRSSPSSPPRVGASQQSSDNNSHIAADRSGKGGRGSGGMYVPSRHVELATPPGTPSTAKSKEEDDDIELNDGSSSSSSSPSSVPSGKRADKGKPAGGAKGGGRNEKGASASASASIDGSSDGDSDSVSLPPLFQCTTGMRDDLRARLPLYKSDWSRPRSLITVGNATIFAFVVQLIPALIFAELMERETHGHLAVAETLLSTGIIGILYAILSGQPLVLLGVTGPVAMLLGTSYGLANTFDSDYWPFFWWLCIWTAVLHLATAMCGLVNFVFRMTPFTSEIFEFFIALSFMYESLRDILVPLQLSNPDPIEGGRGAAYATLVLTIMTFRLCLTFHFAETWGYLTHGLRVFLTSYNMAIAVIVATALSYIPGVSLLGIPRVHVVAPWDWQPTDHSRSWLINPLDGIEAKGIFGALFPAFMLYLLFFVDHNISSMLTQAPKFHLKKPPAYHWDFFCLGLTIIPCGMLGLPPGSGLIPQAPLHTRALATRHVEIRHGLKEEVVTYVEEQRWSALGQSCLMFAALGLFVVLSWIPQGALFGVFFYLGYTAMYGNEIWARMSLCGMQADQRPHIPAIVKVPWRKLQAFTLLQVCSACCIFAVAQFTDAGYIFPALVAALVPLRMFVVPRLFSGEELRYLDPVDETEEEWLMERKSMREAAIGDHGVEAVDLFPGRSSFRAAPDKDDDEWSSWRSFRGDEEDGDGGGGASGGGGDGVRRRRRTDASRGGTTGTTADASAGDVEMAGREATVDVAAMTNAPPLTGLEGMG